MKLRNSYIIAILLSSLLVSTIPASANYSTYLLLDSGNAAYNKGNYTKAIAFYKDFLGGDIESAQVYYNIGNCYYRTNEMGRAILYYEKAERLTPGDPDIQFNLQLANQKIVDKAPSEGTIFIYSDWKKFENKFTEKQWGLICIALLCLSLLLFALYMSASLVLIKQLCFWSGFATIFFCLFTFYIAHEQYELLNSHDTAIVTSSTVTVQGAPEEKATQLFVIHEGTKVWIVKTEGTWTEIKLANGNEGWLNSSEISEI